MRVLLLMRGSAGCGKSTFIDNHGLRPYALSADEIRAMFDSPNLDVNGNPCIPFDGRSIREREKETWDELFKILEYRMRNGEFTVIDATNSKTSEMNRYKELASAYRYRIYCVDMTDIPIEETKRRNANRPMIKRVPDAAIDKFYARFENQQIPSGIKKIKPEELDTIWYRPTDLSEYKKIHVIGDIHGCYTALMQYFNENGGIKDDEYYIFLGDYLDRGIENAETLSWLIENYSRKNVALLEGNHERWIWCWANDVRSKSGEFERHTKPQLDSFGFDKKDAREFYRRLGQISYFTYHGKTFICSHGGISTIPENLTLVSTNQFINGVGTYNDVDACDDSFRKNVEELGVNAYQIHGHRNIVDTPVVANDRAFNLEGKVEFGGCLRVVQIDKDGFTTVEVKNEVFKVKEPEENNVVTGDSDVAKLIEVMRGNPNVFERKFGNISSFNFTKDAFQKGKWDSITNKARGLFIDTKNCKVVARAYDKFFNINERPETKIDMLQTRMVFPATAYVKENGFLGIIGLNPETDELLFCSKSTFDGDFSRYFKEDFYKVYGESGAEKVKAYIKENDCSLVFECCDKERDPHIIDYPETKVVLLDAVKNAVDFEKIPYDELVKIAHKLGLVVKKKGYTLNSWSEFYKWYNDVIADDYTFDGENIEGFVIEDSEGFMTKLKLAYYKRWKMYRGVYQSVLKNGNYKYTGQLLTKEANDFFGYCKFLFGSMDKVKREQARSKASTNICEVRKDFYKWISGK